MDRESFLFYRSYRKAAHRLPEKERLSFYEMLFDYGLDGKEPKDTGDPLVDMALDLIRPLIAANLKNYMNGCKGGAPSESMKGNQNAKKQTQNKPNSNRKQTQNKGNVKDNANDNANDKDNVKDNANVNVNDKEKDKPAALSSENEEEKFDIATWEVPDDFFDEVEEAEDKGK